MDTRRPLSSGLVERIGQKEGCITHKFLRETGMEKHVETCEIPNHTAGPSPRGRTADRPASGRDRRSVRNPRRRPPHGSWRGIHHRHVPDTPEVEKRIQELYPLAPLHNPPTYEGYKVAREVFPHARQVAVFDTAFHQTMPPVAYRYPIPEELYTQHGVRKYGFHGTSHKYVSAKAIEYLGKKDSKIITIHLGNGASVAAVKDGRCIDTSMGLGPLNGLVMGTRSGDIDPSVIFYMVEQLGYSIEDVSRILNKESGLKALFGSSDMRDVYQGLKDNDERARFAFELYCYHIKQYIGAYTASMGGLDADRLHGRYRRKCVLSAQRSLPGHGILRHRDRRGTQHGSQRRYPGDQPAPCSGQGIGDPYRRRDGDRYPDVQPAAKIGIGSPSVGRLPLAGKQKARGQRPRAFCLARKGSVSKPPQRFYF